MITVILSCTEEYAIYMQYMNRFTWSMTGRVNKQVKTNISATTDAHAWHTFRLKSFIVLVTEKYKTSIY